MICSLNRIFLFCSLFLLSTSSAFSKAKAVISINDSCTNSDLINVWASKSIIAAGDSIISYQWKFTGNASISSSITDSVKAMVFKDPTNDTIYRDTIWLKIKTAKGDSDSTRRIISFKYNDFATFNSIARCQDSALSFSNTTDSSLKAYLGAKFTWDFGDSTTHSKLKNPLSHFYGPLPKGTPGTYYPRLTVKWSNGCTNTSPLTANPTYSYADPLAHIFANVSDCKDSSTVFLDKDTTSNSAAWQHFWDFGDGTKAMIDNGNYDSVSHAYSSTGTYTVKYLAITQNGCQGKDALTITVNPRPVASFKYSNPCQKAVTSFTDQSTIASGKIVKYFWDFGDGSTDTSQNPSHVFSSPKPYKVTLIVTSSNGCTSMDTQTISIRNSPYMRISPSNACLGSVSSVKDNTVYLAADTAIKRAWSFGDAGTAITTIDSTAHTYVKAGVYHVGLTATTQAGCMDTVGAFVTIYSIPVAKFSASGTCSGQAVTFTDKSTVANDSVGSRVWTFDDPNASVTNSDTGAGRVSTHHYDSAGTYGSVQLKVTSSNGGCSDSITQSVTILKSPDTAFSSTTACQNSSVQFKYIGRLTAGMKYSWNFGDTLIKNDTSSLRNPSFSYDSGGLFNIQLIIADANGCKSLGGHAIYVFPKPALNITTDNVCADSDITFTANYTFSANIANPPSITNFYWDFGDGTKVNTTSQTYTHRFTTIATQNISLTVTTSDGCTQTINTTVQTYPLPVAQFTPPSRCNVYGLLFADNSTVSTGSIVQYRWDFLQDFTSSVNKDTTYKFQNSNTTNDVKLTVVTDHGCRAEITHTANTYQSPSSDFSILLAGPPYAKCAFDTVSFSSNSAPASGESVVDSFRWLFADGSTDTGIIVSHTFPQVDSIKTYNIRLVSFSQHGCPDTTLIGNPVNTFHQLTIYPKPQAYFSLKNSLKCAGLDVSFYDSSIFGYKVVPNDWSWGYGDGATDNYSHNQYPTHVYAASGTYRASLVVSNAYCSSDSFFMPVTIYPTPVAGFWFTGSCQNTPITFHDSSKVASPSFMDTAHYMWDFDDGFGFIHADSVTTHTYTEAKDYNVTLQVYSLPGECPAKFTKKPPVRVQPAPTARFIATPNPVGNDTAKIAFIDSSLGINISQRVWDFGDSTKFDINPSNPDTHQFHPADPIDTGTFRVKLTITNQFGCSDSTFQFVQVKQILKLDGHFPTAFTPNGDGINDVWHPKTRGVLTYHCFIFDRWGQMVYKTDNWDDPGWKGDYLGNGVKVPEAVYVFYATLTDYDNQVIRKVTGTITLIR